MNELVILIIALAFILIPSFILEAIDNAIMRKERRKRIAKKRYNGYNH